MSEIISRKNALIKQFRKPGDFMVIEGAKLINEALDAGFTPKSALFTEKALKRYPKLYAKLFGTVTVITGAISEYISDTKTPQGVFAMFGRDGLRVTFNELAKSRRLMLLDCVQDPGNVGAIIRSCEAFGFGGVLLSEDSADAFSPKVMRASAGSALRIPCQKHNLTALIPRLKKSGYTIYAAALDENAEPLRNVDFSEKTAVVIGNEGSGVSDKVSELCDKKLYIPIKGAESLNAGVAAGIICYEMSRRCVAEKLARCAEIDRMAGDSPDEKLKIEDFPRVNFGRELIIFSDEE